MSYLFYIGVALFGLITTSQFWLLANLLFTSLEAKRLFGFIGAGAIAGGISGGYLTTGLTHFMDGKNVLFVAAGLLFVNMILNHKIWKMFLPTFHHTVKSAQAKPLKEYPLRLIRNSKHLTYLALIIGISVIVSKLVEFQFSAIAAEHIKDRDGLTAYFGFWFSTSNAVALVIQLLLTQRLVAFLGVGKSLFVLPGALLMTTAAVLNRPVLWAGTTLKLLDISLKQSINKAATELLILPVPMAIKSQAKTYIDVFVDTTATGIGGLMLIFLINGLHFSVRAVCILILGLIAVWIYYAIRVRREYVLSFQKQLGVSLHVYKRKDAGTDVTVAEGIRRTLSSGSIEQILLLLENIEESKDPVLMRDVIPLLQHQSPKVRLAALSTLYYHTDHSIIRQIEPLLKDPDDDVRSRAFSCLLAHTRQNRVAFINAYLTHPDPAISGAALVGLATETVDNPKMQQQFNLQERIQSKLDESYHQLPEEKEDTKITIARAIGYGKISTFYPLLMEFMQDSNPAIVKQGIIAAGNTGDLRFVRILTSFLPGRTTRVSAKKALAKYKYTDLLPILIDMSNEIGMPSHLLMELPALAETMDTEQAIDFLFGFLVQHHHPAVRLEALEVLHKLKTKFPHLTINGKRIVPFLMEEADLYKNTLALSYTAQQGIVHAEEDQAVKNARMELISLLELKLDNDLKRIFWILGLSYPPGLILPLFNDLRNQDPQVRISAVELLDNVLDVPMKKVVKSIIESVTLENLSSEDLMRMDLSVPTEYSCYESILKGKDEKLKHAVRKLVEVRHDPVLDPLMKIEADGDENYQVRNIA